MTEIKEKILASLAGDKTGKRNSFLFQQIKDTPPPPDNKKFNSELLELFIHLILPEDEAKQHWINVFENYERLNKQTGRDTGLHVALLDYFINQSRRLENPIFVEIHVFKETEKMAMVDGLTGLSNRRFFDLCIRKELKRAARYDKDLSLLFLDLDNFKLINDSKGHVFGDEILRRFANILKENCREEDIACRYGGEEFTIILPETTGPGALTFAERIRSQLHNTDIFSENIVTVSGGIAPYPFCGKTAEELLKNADQALYEAKYSGKDRNIISSFDERRKRPRFKETWKVRCVPLSEKFREQNKPKEVFTQDVSLGGIKIEMDDEFAEGTELLLEMDMPNGKTSIIGIIAWAVKVSDSKHLYGIKFTDLKHHQIQKMMQILPSDFFSPPGKDD